MLHFPTFEHIALLSHFSRVRLCVTPYTAAHQAPPSLGFSRQEHWSGLPFPSPMHESEKWKGSRLVVSDSSWPHGLQPTRLLHPWDLPGKSPGVGCHCLLCHHSLRPSKLLALIGIHLSLFSPLCTLIQSNHSSMQTWLQADSLPTGLPGKPDYITPTFKVSMASTIYKVQSPWHDIQGL